MTRAKRLVLIAFVLALTQAVGLKAEDVVQQLTKIKQQWSEAEMKRDIPYLNQLWADDAVFGTSLGTVLNKQQLIELIKGTDRKIDELHSDDIQVRVYGNTAIMTDHTTIRGTYKGAPFGGEYRYIRIFVKQAGKWRVELVQATPLKSQAAETK
jgi:ketosteroid isomerase-like protein